MTHVLNVHKAKTHLSRLLEQAHAGQEIILAKAGKPHAHLMPLSAEAPTRHPGRLTGQVEDGFLDPLPAEELDAWKNWR